MERDPHQLIEGVPHRLLRGRLRPGLPLRPRRDGPRPGAHRRRAQRGLRRRLRRQEHPRLRLLASTSSCTGARAPTSSARRPRSSRASRATAACPASSRRSSRRPRASTCSPRSSTTSRRCPTSRGSSPTAARRSPRSAPRARTGTRMFAVSGHVKQPGRVRGRVRRHHLPRPASTRPSTAAASAAATSSRRSSPAARRRRGSTRSTSTCRSRAGAVGKAGSMLGSGAIVVMDETTDMVKACLRVVRFFARESCGKCTPCREGTSWLEKILAAHRRRPRPARATSTCCSTSATTSAPASTWPPQADHDLPARPVGRRRRSPRRSCASATSSRRTIGGADRDPRHRCGHRVRPATPKARGHVREPPPITDAPSP